MAHVHTSDHWVCSDCMIVLVNDDDSGMDAERSDAVREGIHATCKRIGGHLSPHFDTESGDGFHEFSWHRCGCCLSGLGGERYRFAGFSR